MCKTEATTTPSCKGVGVEGKTLRMKRQELQFHRPEHGLMMGMILIYVSVL